MQEFFKKSKAQQTLIVLCALLLLNVLLPIYNNALGEAGDDNNPYEDASLVILDDPALYIFDEDDELMDWDAYYEALANQEVDTTFSTDGQIDATYEPSSESQSEVAPVEDKLNASNSRSLCPVITSVGKENVIIHGVQSKNKLLEYSIPTQQLEADPDFAALMIEAEKYIGYPYVYGASSPEDSFDCSGFVSWVFIHSGVCDTGRRGANGLYNLCTAIAPEDARPGDLIFFQGTMGPDVEGITHVGIYVGNQKMIHAGDPIGFADLKEEQWIDRFYGYGRLPY